MFWEKINIQMPRSFDDLHCIGILEIRFLLCPEIKGGRCKTDFNIKYMNKNAKVMYLINVKY